MKGFHGDIEKLTTGNSDFRRVLYTGKNMQLVLMTLQPGDEPLKLYTLYGPPEHKDGVVQSTKAEAEARHHDEEWDGKTTE
jgi:hypothetical protein